MDLKNDKKKFILKEEIIEGEENYQYLIKNLSFLSGLDIDFFAEEKIKRKVFLRIEGAKVPFIQSQRLLENFKAFFSFWKVLRYSFAILIFCAISSGVVFASLESLPSEPLYPIKRAFEKTQLALAFSDAKKAEVYLEIAKKRLNEIDRILATSTNDEEAEAMLAIALKDYKENIGKVVQIAMASKDPDLLRSCGISISENELVLSGIAKGASDSTKNELEKTDKVTKDSQNQISILKEDPSYKAFEEIESLEKLIFSLKEKMSSGKTPLSKVDQKILEQDLESCKTSLKRAEALYQEKSFNKVLSLCKEASNLARDCNTYLELTFLYQEKKRTLREKTGYTLEFSFENQVNVQEVEQYLKAAKIDLDLVPAFLGKKDFAKAESIIGKVDSQIEKADSLLYQLAKSCLDQRISKIKNLANILESCIQKSGNQHLDNGKDLETYCSDIKEVLDRVQVFYNKGQYFEALDYISVHLGELSKLQSMIENSLSSL